MCVQGPEAKALEGCGTPRQLRRRQGARAETQEGRDRAAAVPRGGGRDKGPAGGRLSRFHACWDLAQETRWQPCGSAVGGAPPRGAGSALPDPRFVGEPPAREAPRRPPLCLRLWEGGRMSPGRPETAEHQLNACLQPAPSPARSTGAPPYGARSRLPAQASWTAPISLPEISLLPGGFGGAGPRGLSPFPALTPCHLPPCSRQSHNRTPLSLNLLVIHLLIP